MSRQEVKTFRELIAFTEGEHIVAMTSYKTYVIVATQFSIYKIDSGTVEELKLEVADD